MYDVVVVGAGPAGSTAAKCCAEKGLKTLIVEKRQLPRDKVCSGMIMGPVAHALLKEIFGELPVAVQTRPGFLSGYIFHVPGIGSETLENHTPLTWRRNLDHWMTRQACSKGVEIWEQSRLLQIKEQTGHTRIEILVGMERQEVKTKFLIGADGAASVVRKALFPELKVHFSQVYQELHQGRCDLDPNHLHWFYPVEHCPSGFTVHHKDGLLVVDAGGRIGQVGGLFAEARHFLAKKYNFDLDQKPVWRGSCLVPVLFRAMTSHLFKPALGNVLLVGDAAGLIMPVSNEGIGVGMRSAQMAAESIMKSLETGEPVDTLYLEKIRPILSLFVEIVPHFAKIKSATKGGGRTLPQALREGYLSTLKWT
jgi:flavin-dependent dehydrogenase